MQKVSDKICEQIDKIDLSNQGVKMTFTAFAAIGTYFICKNIYSGMRGLTKYCLLPRRNLKERYGGGWALVTGASDGIGKRYCFELAKSGFNIVLMARNVDKMNEVAREIRETYNVKTDVIVYDFMQLASEQSVNELGNVLQIK